MIDYRLFYKRRFTSVDDIKDSWDLLISAYNNSERVISLFDGVRAKRKHWLIHPEYEYRKDEYPSGEVFAPASANEADFAAEYSREAGWPSPDANVCLDSTGFMRPQLMFLLRRLRDAGLRKVDILYTEPIRYVDDERTVFAQGPVISVRQVAGYEGVHVPDASGRDLLVIGMGYDDKLIRRVAEDKASAHKLQLFGFPALSAEMYQENVFRASRAAESLGGSADQDIRFAPANDPFVTAMVLHEAVEEERRRRAITNLYLAPLGTKAQVLGFAIYYLTECIGQAASVIFPQSPGYTRETTKGILGIWKYTFEFVAEAGSRPPLFGEPGGAG